MNFSRPNNSKLNKLTKILPTRKELETIFPLQTILSILAGTAILSFAMINIHRRVHVTEGGVMGMILLLNYWFHIPASILSPLLDGVCYLVGFRFLGKHFLIRSLAASSCIAVFLRFWESMPYLLPDLSSHPLTAAILGGCLVGIGAGLIVRQDTSGGGDDALALVIRHLTRCKLSRAYMFTDFTVLLLSLSYIPFARIAYSLITVTISSLVIDQVQIWGTKRKKTAAGNGTENGVENKIKTEVDTEAAEKAQKKPSAGEADGQGCA